MFADSSEETRKERVQDSAAAAVEDAENKNIDELWGSMEEVGVKCKTKTQTRESKRTSENYNEIKKKGKKRKNIQLRNVFYEERTADQITEPNTEEQTSVKKKRTTLYQIHSM